MLCPSPDGQGFLLARDAPLDPHQVQAILERHGPPWSIGSTPTDWPIGSHIQGLEMDDSGRYLAATLAAGGTRVSLWDTQENKPIAEIPHGDPVTWIGFTPDGSVMISITSLGEQGRVVLTPVRGGDSRIISLGGVKLAAVHPSCDTLVAADSLQRLLILDLGTGRVEHEMIAPFGEQAVRRYFDAPDTVAAMRREFRDNRRIIKETGLPPPPGFASTNQFIKQVERDYAELIRGMCDQAVKVGPPGGIYRMRFDPSGEQLYLGTMTGLRAFSWHDIASLDGSLPEPAVKIDLGAPSGHCRTCDHDVYDLEFDPANGRVLLAGGDGRVHFLEPSSGRFGDLLQLPGLPPIRRVTLSRDRTTLALVAHPDAVSPPREARGPVLQFWDYRLLATPR